MASADDSVIASFEKWTPPADASSLGAASFLLQLRTRADTSGNYLVKVMAALAKRLGGIDLPLQEAIDDVPFEGAPAPQDPLCEPAQYIRAITEQAVGRDEVLLAMAVDKNKDLDTRALAALRAFRNSLHTRK